MIEAVLYTIFGFLTGLMAGFMIWWDPEVIEPRKYNWNDKNPKKPHHRRKKKWGRTKREKGIKRIFGKVVK